MPYLDNSATTRQHPEVTKAMLPYMEETYGNPSSLHRMGFAAEKALREARERVAKSVQANRDEIFFTSGGTQADNLSIIGTANAMSRKGKRIITTQIEHPAVLEPCRYLERRGFEVTYLDVDSEGRVDMEHLAESLTDQTVLVSVMHVNNEIGTIQPLEAIGALVRSKSEALFHTDAVQSYGKLPIPVSNAQLDFVSASSHKIHGPKGMGFLYIKKGNRIEPLMYGGGQEKDINPGTENLPAIAGFGEAARIAADRMPEQRAYVNSLKESLLSQLTEQISDIKVNGSTGENGSPYILNVSFPGTRAEVLLHILEQDGIYVSTGSACSSHKKGKSRVLAAIGLSDREIEGALRFSFSVYNTMDEMEYTAAKVKKAVEDMRSVLRGKSR